MIFRWKCKECSKTIERHVNLRQNQDGWRITEVQIECDVGHPKTIRGKEILDNVQ